MIYINAKSDNEAYQIIELFDETTKVVTKQKKSWFIMTLIISLLKFAILKIKNFWRC